ncbi:MAG: TetR/AcrR family transcriptional regulator [Acidimicrobiales bacterium]
MSDTAATTTRERILDAALDLAARKGADGTSMRELAEACEVNVAALYYHFPSKADLLRSVIEERHYDLMMATVEVPPASAGSDTDRLRDLLLTIWTGMQGEQRVWRLLLAESCHHNTDAQEVACSLVGSFESITADWLAQGFGPLAVPLPVAAHLVADFLFSNVARVAIGAVTDEEVAGHAEALAAVITGSRSSG